jgi:hypothetical protein
MSRKNKVIASLTAVGLAAIIGGYNLLSNVKEPSVNYVGFHELEDGWKVSEIDIPTQGRIIMVKKLEDNSYQTKSLDDGSLRILGQFEYEIAPNHGILPYDITEKQLNNPDFWIDKRLGTMTFTKEK